MSDGDMQHGPGGRTAVAPCLLVTETAGSGRAPWGALARWGAAAPEAASSRGVHSEQGAGVRGRRVQTQWVPR